MQFPLGVASGMIRVWSCPQRIRVVLTSLLGGKEGEKTFTKGNLCHTFRQKQEDSEFCFVVYAVFPLPSVQDNTYATVGYFGVAYSDPLQWPGKTLNQYGAGSW